MARVVVKLPDLGVLDEFFSFDPKSGELRIKKQFGKTPAGELAGYVNCIGYLQVAFRGKIYSVHRIAWKIFYREEPIFNIDHIDGVRSNTKIENLRRATFAQNNWNRKLTSKSKTGIKGVCWDKSAKKWRVVIYCNDRCNFIGNYVDFDEACRQADAARIRFHGEFAHNGISAIGRAA